MDQLPGRASYLIGNDPKRWLSGLPTYAKIRYKDVYPRVDLVFYGKQGQLEYDFVVAPGGDPRGIQLQIEGARRLEEGASGDLVLESNCGQARLHKPVVYQELSGVRTPVGGRYLVRRDGRIHFQLQAYDAGRPLIIDPVLTYSTYLGGSGAEASAFGGWSSIAVDSSGNAYVAGATASSDFPVVQPVQRSLLGRSDAFVVKLNSTGTSILYSTYLGGSGDDHAYGIAVDSAGNAYVTGETAGSDFPTTPGAFQPSTRSEQNIFIAKLDSTGARLLYSTRLGHGVDSPSGIAIDSLGNAYLTGSTTGTDFPTTPGALQSVLRGGQENFVTKLNSTGTALVYSTYLGGNADELPAGIAVDAAGSAYLTGTTLSTNFPVTPGAFQTTLRGRMDAFVAKLNSTGTALLFSTYLGGSGPSTGNLLEDGGDGIAVDSSGNSYIVGVTLSRDFPVTPGAFQTALAAPGGQQSAFVVKVNPTGSALVYSTYLGGTGWGLGIGFAVDSSGLVYVTGCASVGFPTSADAYQTTSRGGADAFYAVLSASGASLVYSTLLGGSKDDGGSSIALDPLGNAYITGWTASADFPTTRGVSRAAYAGGAYDAFVAKIGTAGTAAGALSVQVTGVGGGAIAGATVSVSGAASQTSSATGTATFSVAPAIYDVQAWATGFQPASFTVTVASGQTSSLDLTLVPRGTGTIATVSVPATADQDFDTGVSVSAGQMLVITASGRWGYGPVAPGYPLGPDGILGCTGGTGWTLGSAPNCGALAARIGSGNWFYVGPAFAGTANATGRLFLSINDLHGVFWDNVGALAVTVTVVAAPPPPGVQLAVNQVDTSRCPQISLVNSVTDSNGTLIPGLTGSNFSLTEDNQPRTISVSQTSSGSSAVSVALVIDVSGSLSSSGVSDEVAAAKAFLNLLGPQDRVALITFQSTVTTRVSFTTDRAAINSALNSLTSGGNTALLDAVVKAAQLIGAEPQGRRAVVLMTDGYENASTSSEAQALAAAKAANSPVFTIGFTSDIKEDELRRIADGTGGIFYKSATSANLQDILTRLGQVVTSQYIVSYTTANPAVSHQGTLTVNASGQAASKGFTVTACSPPPSTGGLALTLGTVNSSQCPQIRVPVSVASGGQALTGLGAANFTLVEDGQSRSISVSQTSGGYEIAYTSPNPGVNHQVMVTVNYSAMTDSKTTTVPSCSVPCSTVEPALNITLQPGFYIAEVTGSTEGYWGMEALAQRGDLSGGFNLGGGLQEKGTTPAFGGFYLRDTQSVFIRATAQVVPGGNTSNFSECVRLLDNKRQPIGTDQCGTTVVEFQRTLSSGFYIVEVRSGGSSPRATLQLGLGANYFSGGVDVGGFVAPGLTGFGAFFLPADQGAQEAKIKVLGRPTYGSVGTCNLQLRLLDGNRNLIKTVP